MISRCKKRPDKRTDDVRVVGVHSQCSKARLGMPSVKDEHAEALFEHGRTLYAPFQ